MKRLSILNKKNRTLFLLLSMVIAAIALLLVAVFVISPNNSNNNEKINELKRCDTLEEQDHRYPKYLCYRQVAQKYNDISICNKIPLPQEDNSMMYPSTRYHCLAFLKKDISICDQIVDMGTNDEYEKGRCYADIALLQQDVSICSKILSKVTQADCYYQIAIKTGDESICELIPVIVADFDYKGNCYIDLRKEHPVLETE